MPKQDSCRICDNKNLQCFLDLGETPLANRFLQNLSEEEPFFPLDVYLCTTCSLVQLGYVVPPDVLFKDYIYVTGTSSTMPRHFDGLAESVYQKFLINQKHPFVVEAGSNDGTLLLSFAKRGAKVLGIEPATNIASYANERGVETKNDFFSETVAKQLLEKEGSASVVVGNNVFAHVDDIHDFVKGVKTLLAPEGVFVFEVPYLFDLIDHLEFDTIYHEHLSYFSVNALSALFSRHQLVILSVEHYPIHGGSLRIYVSHRNSKYTPDDSVAHYQTEEKNRGVFSLEIYQQFAQRVYNLRDELLALLDELRSKGARIAGYGSPAKGNTLLNFMKLGTDRIEYLVDKNPRKQNLLTPGMHIPVYPVERLLEDKPEYALILAWNFAKEILVQQEQFLKTGGQFILPIPTPKILSKDALQ